MMSAGDQEPTNWREGRRLRAWELGQQGWPQCRIAEALGVSAGAVSQWFKQAEQAGPTALRHRKPPGKLPRLDAAQQAEVPELLALGAEAWGFRGDRWTRARVASVLDEVFGVEYHPAHLSRLLKTWGFSLQKPVRLARQRDEAAIRHWRAERWPALEKRGWPRDARPASSTRRASTRCRPW